MTWLKGTTTLGAMAPLFTQLACGEVADDSAVTCAAGDRWVRENAGYDTIRTKAALDFTPPVWQMRPGYFTLMSLPNPTKNTVQSPGYVRNLLRGSASVCKVTSPYTSVNGNASRGRWIVNVRVRSINTTPGDYSTATIDINCFDADSNNAFSQQTSQPLTSTGAYNSVSNGLHIQVTDPSGTLSLSTEWLRGFTSTYMYGVDFWPWWARRGNGVSTPTWTIAPPGVAGTDYAIIDQSYNQAPRNLSVAGSIVVDTGGFLSGLGIMTATGLGANPIYSGTYPIALMKLRMWNSATLGIIGIDPGPSPTDFVNGSVSRNSGSPSPLATWVKCIQTVASATSSTPVQYFLSVKSDGIYVVLNADPGSTGKLGTAYYGSFTPNDPTYDKFPIYYSGTPGDFTGNTVVDGMSGVTPIPYFLQKRMLSDAIAAAVGTATSTTSTTLTDSGASRVVDQDVGLVIYAGTSFATVVSNTANTWTVSSWTGGTPSSTSAYTVQRDWQTGFHRYDFGIIGTSPRYVLTDTSTLTALGFTFSTNNAAPAASVPVQQPKPSTFDDKWWLWGSVYVENSTMGTAGATDNGNFVRGYQNTRFFYIPGTGWGNGDELTDTISGEKFLLLIPDYPAAAQRVSIGTNTYVGGVAVAEL